MDISSQVTATIPAPRFPASVGNYGYTDGEAILQLVPGNIYYNVTDSCYRGYNGVIWGCITGQVFPIPIPIIQGGTGATTAAGALVNLGAVSTATTVNGHALSSNVTVSASDLTTGTLPHAQLPTLLSGDIPNNAANTTGNAATATYATSAGTATDPTKLPLTGGTLTGALNGTSASFSGNVSAGSETLGSPLLPASGGTGSTTAAGANLNITGVTQTGTLGTSSQVSAFPGTVQGATVEAGTTVANNLPLNVLSYGATGGNSTLDTTGLTNAIAAACATAHGNGGVVEVDIPVTSSAYVISSPIALCSNLHVHGVGGHPSINAAAGLFTVTGQIHGEVDHLDIEGGGGTSTYAIQHLASGTSDLLWLYHDNIIYGFGNGTAGGCFNFASGSDSNSLKIYHNHLGCDTADVKKSGPADTMDIADNLMTSWTTTSGGWCIDASASGGGLASDVGAGTQRIEHNNMQCAVQGPIRINSQATWLIEDNEWEYEGGGTLTNAQGAAYDFIAAGFMTVSNNLSNTHTNASYDYYVGNGVGSSDFSNNWGLAVVSAYSFFVGTGIYNTFENNQGANGPSVEYSSGGIGIQGGSQYSAGRFFGCRTSTFGGLEFCPTVQFDAAATFGSTVGITGTLGVTGATTLNSTLAVTGSTTVGGTLGVIGAATFGSTLNTSGYVEVTTGDQSTARVKINNTAGNEWDLASGACSMDQTSLAACNVTAGTVPFQIGAGAPSRSCTAGVYINTSATSASTVLYVCYGSAWTAVTVP
jgi:hypothetical protein